MKLAVAGGTGLIGSAVCGAAEAAGHEVAVIHVPRPDKSEAHHREQWQLALEQWQPADFSGYDAVMYFGGEPINTRWTEKKRARMKLSRVMPCKRLAECVAQAEQPPRVIVSASATGYYGDRGDESVTEKTSPGKGFMALAAQEWEQAWAAAGQAGIRVVNLRFGVVLSPKGGALKMMLPAFKAGLGGKMGTGRQWMPWITDYDAGRIAVWAMESESVTGPVNAMSPEPARNADFTKALGAALHRPAVTFVPEPVLKVVFGEMAEETILLSCRAVPARAAAAGFHFEHVDIGTALRAVLKKENT